MNATELQLATDGDLTITTLTTLNLNSNNLTMQGTGDVFSNDGTLVLQGNETITGLTQDTDSGTWYYTGAAGTNTFNLQDFGVTDYFKLIINAGDDTIQLTNPLTLASGGNILLSSGTLHWQG